MTSAIPMEELLGRWMADTMESVESMHLSFIGPHCPDGELKDSAAAQTLRERLGYRYYISHVETEYSFASDDLIVRLTWDNAGLSPLYWNWPVTMYVYDKDGKLTFWENVDIDLRDLTPDEQIETETHIPLTETFRQGFRVGIGINSPEEADLRIRLAMEAETENDVQIVYTFTS